MSADADNVTKLLADWSNGNQQALEELLPLIYNELRRLAHGFLYRERPGHTLQTTALVHEAYLKLIDQRDARWQNRAHFFAIAAQAMRRILIDSARKRGAVKRGGPGEKVSLTEAAGISLEPDRALLALDEAMRTKAAVRIPKTPAPNPASPAAIGGLRACSLRQVTSQKPSKPIARPYKLSTTWSKPTPRILNPKATSH